MEAARRAKQTAQAVKNWQQAAKTGEGLRKQSGCILMLSSCPLAEGKSFAQSDFRTGKIHRSSCLFSQVYGQQQNCTKAWYLRKSAQQATIYTAAIWSLCIALLSSVQDRTFSQSQAKTGPQKCRFLQIHPFSRISIEPGFVHTRVWRRNESDLYHDFLLISAGLEAKTEPTPNPGTHQSPGRNVFFRFSRKLQCLEGAGNHRKPQIFAENGRFGPIPLDQSQRARAYKASRQHPHSCPKSLVTLLQSPSKNLLGSEDHSGETTRPFRKEYAQESQHLKSTKQPQKSPVLRKTQMSKSFWLTRPFKKRAHNKERLCKVSRNLSNLHFARAWATPVLWTTDSVDIWPSLTCPPLHVPKELYSAVAHSCT